MRPCGRQWAGPRGSGAPPVAPRSKRYPPQREALLDGTQCRWQEPVRSLAILRSLAFWESAMDRASPWDAAAGRGSHEWRLCAVEVAAHVYPLEDEPQMESALLHVLGSFGPSAPSRCWGQPD
jgi:hypothetical protein